MTNAALQSRKRAESDTTVHIRVRGYVAEVLAPVPNDAHAILECVTPQFGPGGQYGYRQHSELIRYFTPSATELVLPRGLVERLKAGLRARGYRVHVTDHTDCAVFERLNRSLLTDPGLRISDRAVLDAVAGNMGGQIVIQRLSDVPRLIALMAELFARENIVVVTRNRRHTLSLYRKLAKRSNRPVTVKPGSECSILPRFHVGHAYTAGMGSEDYWSVVILADQRAALDKQVLRPTAHNLNSLRFCFVHGPRELGPREGMLLEMLCGPVIYQEPNPYGDPAEVRVVLLESPPAATASRGDTTALQRKRTHYWHNTRRNARIAETARGIASGDATITAQLGIPGVPPGTVAPNQNHQPECRVSVLVESTEHGRALLHHLDNWSLKHGVRDENIPDELDCEIFFPVMHRDIATYVYAARYGVKSDVVIHAGAGPAWPLPGECFPRRVRSGKPDGGVLVVDFVDSGNQWSMSDTRQRMADYRRRGWHVQRAAGVDLNMNASYTGSLPPSAADRPG